MSVSGKEFREVMGCLAGGVAVVTARAGAGAPRGFTATAVCSVSLDPPLVLVCVGRDAHTLATMRAAGTYALNFMGADGLPESERFAGDDERKFADVEWTPAPGGSPLLPRSIAWVECAVERDIEAGDHQIVIGRVMAAGAGPPDPPLVHFRGRYHTVEALDP